MLRTTESLRRTVTEVGRRPLLEWGGHPPVLALETAAVTHPGRRRLNQDQHLIADLRAARKRSESRSRGPRGEETLLVVADGMGGHPRGEVASLLAVRVLLNELVQGPLEVDDPLGRLELAVRTSDEALHRASSRRQDLATMGTTLTTGWWIPPMLFVAHVGDSRLYLLRDGRLARLTRDHTLEAELAARTRGGDGRADAPVRPDSGDASAFSHVLTQALGGREPGIEPDLAVRRLEAGDVLLLCTDGLVRGLADEVIARALERAPSAAVAATALLEGALASDDSDNITALVARVTRATNGDVAGGVAPGEAS